ncbi:MAG: hypothetical protein RLZZ154_690 [Actinomycetota bacterium]
MNKKFFALVLTITLIPTAAIAATPKPTQAQIDAAKKIEAEKKAAADAAAKKLSSAKKTLQQLTAIATAKRKIYIAAQNDLKMKTKQADIAMKHLQAAQASVSTGKRTIGKLLSADGPQDLADRLSTLDALGENNSNALDRFKSAEIVASAAQKAADIAKKAQAEATVKVAAAKKAADEAAAMQQDEVDKLQAIQDKLAKELAVAQKTRLTLEQQRQIALLEEANAGRALITPDQSKIWPDIGFTGRSSTRSTEAMRLAAVEFAKKQVLAKKNYVWGSEGPTTFDCSGLVYAAYKSAGLGWPNWDRLNSSLYWVATKRVPISEMVPGDLVFYSYKGTVSTIHHIAIYAGDGMMWEAHNKDKDLRFNAIRGSGLILVV